MFQLRIPKTIRLLVLLAVFATATSFFFPGVWTATAGPGEFDRGQWLETAYSQQSQNLCNSAANETCVEWCTISAGEVQGTGDLCCGVQSGAQFECSHYRP